MLDKNVFGLYAAEIMNGLIAYIDILGYQSFLENNTASQSTEYVLELINEAPKAVCKQSIEVWKKGPKPPIEFDYDQFGKNLEHLVFSDTIVLFHPLDDCEAKRAASFLAFSLIAKYLTGQLFMMGLPARGALHIGEYLRKDYCFAGKGIVEAHNLCNLLDFSGTVLSEESSKILNGLNEVNGFNVKAINNTFVKYLAPLKGREVKMICLNWVESMTEAAKDELRKDVIQYVISRFWAYEKDVPLAVDGKIRNTCKLLRKFLGP